MDANRLSKDPFSTAFIHKSFAKEHGVESYERLEFLGDAVLDLVVSEVLFRESYKEGELTRLRASAVCKESLQKVSIALGFSEKVKLGHGIHLTANIEADVVEAYIGALFLEGGYEKAKAFILKELMTRFHFSEEKDPKTTVQELLQHQGILNFGYTLLERTGPDHAPNFLCALIVEGKEVATGEGSSKRLAEQKAAERYLDIHATR
ncbi:ribonuclease III [Guggenheimella bovis]